MTLSTLSQIVRINPNTVTTYETWTEWKKIPLGTCSLEYIKRIDTHFIEDMRKLIDEGNVDIALTVLNNLSSFSYLYSWSEVSTSNNN